MSDALREQLVLAGTSLLVAVDESGVVVGFALSYPLHEPEPWMESLHVALSSVVVGNVAAARFYERLGGVMIVE